MVIKSKSKNNNYTLHSVNNLRKGKSKILSLENEEDKTDEKIQSELRKTFKPKSKVEEIILMKTKNSTKVRKIKL